MKKYLLLLFIPLIVCDLNSGSSNEPSYVFQTTILGIETDPDTVSVNQLITLRCNILDSLNIDDYTFTWGLDSLVAVNGRTDSSVVQWRATPVNNFQGIITTLEASVLADNGDESKRPALKTFEITIRQ